AVEQWGAAAIRIVPNYHQYELTDYVAAELMEQVVRHDVALFVQLRLDDERNQYPLMRVPAVSAGAVAQLARGFPEARVVALGAYDHELTALASTPNVCADIAFVERAAAGDAFPMDRRLFGSHTPFLYTRSARMKLDYGEMTD